MSTASSEPQPREGRTPAAEPQPGFVYGQPAMGNPSPGPWPYEPSPYGPPQGGIPPAYPYPPPWMPPQGEQAFQPAPPPGMWPLKGGDTSYPSPSKQQAGATAAVVLLWAVAASALATSAVNAYFAFLDMIPEDLWGFAEPSFTGLYTSYGQDRTMTVFYSSASVVLTMLAAAALIVCAISLRRGRRWARPLGTVSLIVAVLSNTVLPYLSLSVSDLFGSITVALAVASVIALFRRPVAAYLDSMNEAAEPRSGQ